MDFARVMRTGRCGRAARLSGGAAPPRVVSVVVAPGGASIAITFSQAINATVSSAGWIVRATGGDLVGDLGDLAPGDSVSNTTTLTFDTNIRSIAAGETVALEYGAATGTTVSRATGIEVAPFTGRAAVNNA